MNSKYPIFCFLALIIISGASFGQKTDNILLKLAPLGLMEPYGQNIHLGSEFSSKGRFSIETDFATYVKIFNRDERRYKDRIGIKIKPEIRYYLNSVKPKDFNNEGFYLANELYLTIDKFKRGNTYVHFDQTSLQVDSQYYDYEKIRRFIIGDNFKFGYQSVTNIKLTFDYYIGVGIQYYNASYDYEITDPECCKVMRLFEIPVYKKFRPAISLGIKIGYVL